jgi:cytochrome P450
LSLKENGGVLYDPYAVEVHQDPDAVYGSLRDEHPVYHNPARGFWALSRYDDVQAAARDWETYSNAAGVSLGEYAHFFGDGDLLETDPPVHTRLRTLLRHRFSVSGLKSMEASVRSHAEKLIDALLASAAPDLVSRSASGWGLRNS